MGPFMSLDSLREAGTSPVQFGDPVPVGTNEVTVVDGGAGGVSWLCHLMCLSSVPSLALQRPSEGAGSGVYIDANYHVRSHGKLTSDQPSELRSCAHFMLLEVIICARNAYGTSEPGAEHGA